MCRDFSISRGPQKKSLLMCLIFPYLYFHSEFQNVPDYNDSCKSSVGNQEYSHRCFYKVLEDINSKVPKEKKSPF